jgi:glycine/D-amino acid oxidase-like deaminating enzyme
VGVEPPTIPLHRIERVNNGVRPFRRSGPRVEIERCFGKTIVHNYGHGAHGWTIGYAAAKEAAVLAGLL